MQKMGIRTGEGEREGGGRCRIVNKGGCSHRSYYAPFEQPRSGISWSNFSVSFIEDNMVAMINNFHKFLMLTTFHLQKEICFLMWNNCYHNKHFLNCDIFGWYFNTKSVHQHPMKFWWFHYEALTITTFWSFIDLNNRILYKYGQLKS